MIDYTELSNDYAPYRIYDEDGLEWGDGPYDRVADACDDAGLFAAGATSFPCSIPETVLTVIGRTADGVEVRIASFPSEA